MICGESAARQHWCERKHYILEGSLSKMSRLSRQQEEVPPDAPDQMINVYVKSIAMLNGQRSLTISINVNATVLQLMQAICERICDVRESTPVFRLTFIQQPRNKEITAYPGTRYYDEYMNMRLYQWGFNENNSTVMLSMNLPRGVGNEPPNITWGIQSNIRLNF
jgi:hypothetical protein